MTEPSNTPRTDAAITCGFPLMVKADSMRELERELAEARKALSEGNADAARYKWLANRVLACDYGDNDTAGREVGWRIRHDLLVQRDGKRQPAFMYGASIDKAIDAALNRESEIGTGNEGSDGEEVRSFPVGGAQLAQTGSDVGGMPLSVGRSRPDQTAMNTGPGKAGSGGRSPASSCPDAAHMGEHACADRSQCWEPCGELGNSEAHVRVASVEDSAAVDAALRCHAVCNPLRPGLEAALSLVREQMHDGSTARFDDFDRGRERGFEQIEGNLIDRLKAVTQVENSQVPKQECSECDGSGVIRRPHNDARYLCPICIRRSVESAQCNQQEEKQ